jgi:lysophospholipase L1-like esterase
MRRFECGVQKERTNGLAGNTTGYFITLKFVFSRRFMLAASLSFVATMYVTVIFPWGRHTLGIVPTPAVTPMPLISGNASAHASSGTAANANDADYTTFWIGSDFPSWLAYDLSSIPTQQRGRVILAWYNDPITPQYDHDLQGRDGVRNPGSYTVEAHSTSGGSVPQSGWVPLADVANNRFHSRQHLLDLAGYNWVRIRVTAADGGSSSVALNMDLHDASSGAEDSWIFYGDSITQAGFSHSPVADVMSFSQLIHAANPTNYPSFENGGTSGLTSADGVANISEWLAIFPGRYVTLNFGSNDASQAVSPEVFYANMTSLVQTIRSAGKVAIIPTIPWGDTSHIRNNGPALVAQIHRVYAENPQIVRGPDLWTFFHTHPAYLSGDNVHLTEAGNAALRQEWVRVMLENVYAADPIPTVTPIIGSVTPTVTSALPNVQHIPLILDQRR